MDVLTMARQLGLTPTDHLGYFGHSEICRTSEGLIIKNIEHQTLSTLSPNEQKELAEHIATTSRAYYLRLAESGVSVPTRYELICLSDDDGHNTRVAAITTDMGPDCKTLMLNGSDSDVWFYVSEMLQSIEAVAFRDDVGIDPHPPNYAGKSVAYVDFFQVQLYWDGQRLIGFPQSDDPDIVDYSWKRYCTFGGTWRILRFNTLRLHPGNLEWEQEFNETTQGSLYPPLAREARQLLEGTQEMEVRRLLTDGHIAKAKDIVGSLGPFDTEELRGIALWVIRDSEKLDGMFPLSRLDFRVPAEVRATNLQAFKTILCDSMQ
ncbi:MAG: hypothetical protein NT135_01000 [Candidatus Berkelbacteria bacterium]|nr:hypothetical protein [Candidatus Berkelbacteria bacterium]